jgi:hypothetical protein
VPWNSPCTGSGVSNADAASWRDPRIHSMEINVGETPLARSSIFYEAQPCGRSSDQLRRPSFIAWRPSLIAWRLTLD